MFGLNTLRAAVTRWIVGGMDDAFAILEKRANEMARVLDERMNEASAQVIEAEFVPMLEARMSGKRKK
jgi:hypothetical protein